MTADHATGVAITRLKQRRDFQRAARGKRAVMPGLVLQAIRAQAKPNTEPMLSAGFTASRKVGNAVKRNRARRRLKEAARLVICHSGHPGYDYVLIGRQETLTRPFKLLLADLTRALSMVHAGAAVPEKN